MFGNTFFSANLLLAYAAYFVGAASPGPSNLAIMSIAANDGRKAALAFAAGVISGSMFWATVATVGISAALIAYSEFIVTLKIAGGLYLLWLAFKSGRAALSASLAASPKAGQSTPLKALYTKGALLHLTNPKAVLVWVSIVALSSNGSGATHAAVIPGCAVIGCLVFSGYAFLFSMESARRLYTRARRGLDGSLAIVFAMTGIKLLAWPSK